MQVKLIALTQPIELQNLEQLIEYAGRKCTKTCEKTGQNTARFVKARVKQGHTSILEHISFTFEIDGISRSCLAQLTRHRIASYSVESQRYTKQTSVLDNVIPQTILEKEEAKKLYDSAISTSDYVYTQLCKMGIPREDARFVLNISRHTNLVMTMNLREILHFLDLRLDKSAQLEIRELARNIKNIVIEYCPSVF